MGCQRSDKALKGRRRQRQGSPGAVALAGALLIAGHGAYAPVFAQEEVEAAQGAALDLSSCKAPTGAIEPDLMEALASEGGGGDDALERLRDVAQVTPQNAPAQYYLGVAEARAGNMKQARGAAEAAYSMDPGCAPFARFAGDMRHAAGELKGAAEAWSRVVVLYPQDLDTRRKLARALIGSDQRGEAIPHMKVLAEAYPQEVGLLVTLGTALAWAGDHEGAVAALDKASALDSASFTGEHWKAYGLSLREVKRPADAIVALEKALSEVKKGDKEEQSALTQAIGWCHIDLKNYPSAIAAFERASELTPKSPDVWANLARAYHAAKETPKAVDPYRKALTLSPGDDALRLEAAQVISTIEDKRGLAIDLLEPIAKGPSAKAQYVVAQAEIMSWIKSRRPEAIARVSLLLDREPDNANGAKVLRDAVLWSDPAPSLLPHHDRLVALYPEDSEVLRHRADCLASAPGRQAEALPIYTALLDQTPGDTILRLSRAELLLTLGAAPKAEIIEDLRRVSRDLPADSGEHKRVADDLMMAGDAEGALIAYDRALVSGVRDVYTLMGKAKAQEELNQIDAATETLTLALAAAKPGEETAAVKAQQSRLRNIALVREARRLEGEGRLAEAEELRLAYVKANPGDAHGWTGLGGVRAQRKEFQWALTAYQKALELDPKHVEALKGASGACLALGRYDQAESYLRAEIALAPTPEAQARLQTIRVARELATVQGQISSGRSEAAMAALATLYMDQPESAEVAMLYGQALLEVERPEDAVGAFERALSLKPEDLEALRGLATALWRSERREEARDTLSRAREVAPPSEVAAIDDQLLFWDLELAEELKRVGRVERSFEYYRRAYERAPEAGYVLGGLSGLYWYNQQLDLAAKYYTRALTLDPSNGDAALGVAETLLAQGKADVAYSLLKDLPTRNEPEIRAAIKKVTLARDLMAVDEAWAQGQRSVALDVAEDVARRNPGQIAPWQRLARLNLREGRYIEALTYYQRALAIDPDSESDLYGTIATLQAMGRHSEAARLIAQARSRESAAGTESEELNRLEAAGWAARGEAHKLKGEMRSAFAAYEQAMELAPGTPWVLAGMAGVYAENAQLEPALDLYEIGLRVDPEDPICLEGHGTVLLGLGRADEAAPSIDALQEIEGDTDRVRRLQARYARETGDVGEAIAIFEAMYESGDDDPQVLEGLASAYLKANQPSIALDLISRELMDRPNDVDLLRIAGGCLRSMGRSDIAVPVYRKLAIYWPSERASAELEAAFLGAYVEAAEEAKARGDDDQAEALYEEALSRDPENHEILRSLGGLEAREGNTDEALAYFKTALRTDPEDPWSIVGYANMKAAEGDTQAALRVLQRGWEDTEDPWVGLNRARILIEQERYSEAKRQLKEVEEVIEEQSAIRKAGESMSRQYGRTTEAQRVVSRFQAVWMRISRVEPEDQPQWDRAALPIISTQDLRAQEAVLNNAKAGEGSKSVGPRPGTIAKGPTLPDVDPSIKSPEAIATTPADAPRKAKNTGELDLSDVDRLLAELRQGQAKRGEEERQAEPRPVLTFDEDYDLAAEEGAAQPGRTSRSSALAYELDSYEPFEPTVSRRGPVRRTVREAPDPAEMAEDLRKKLEDETASSLYVAGGVDGRTGSPGSTALVAAMGDIQLHLRPTPGFSVFGYAAPVVATNIIQTQQGFGVGGGFYAKPGPLDLRFRVGSSPIGFITQPYLVGAASVGLYAIPRLSVGLEVGREEVRDSLLSWAGLTDAESGTVFGRVSRDRLSLQGTFYLDARAQLSIGGDVAKYVGINVEENRWRQGRVDARYLSWRDEEQNVWIGLDGIFFAFEKQLDQFDPGYGGYFSPEVFLMARARLYYEGLLSDERLRVKAHGGVGAQFTEGVETDYLAPGLRPALTAGLLLGYRLSRGLEIGARYEFDNAGANYTRNTGWLFLEKRFGVDGEF